MAHVLEAIFVVDGDARVRKAARRLRQVLLADLDDELIDLDEVDVAHCRVAQELAHRATVAAADDEDVVRIRIDAHRHVRDHLVVDELIHLRQHHVAVERQEAAELLRVEDVDALEFAAARVELAVHLDGEADVWRVVFGKPEFHRIKIPPCVSYSTAISGRYRILLSCHFTTLSRAIVMSSGPVI